MAERSKLTKRVIDGLEPGVEAYLLWDSQLPGLGVRVSPNGKKTYVVQYRIGGGRGARERRVTLGQHGILTPEEARTQAQAMLGEARGGADPVKTRQLQVERGAIQTVNDLCDLWKRDAAPIDRRNGKARTPKQIHDESRRLDAHVRPLLGRRRLDELDRRDIERLRDDITIGKTAGTTKMKARGFARVRGGAGAATRTVRLLAAVLSFGVERGVIASNPVKGIKLRPAQKREVFLAAAQIEELGLVLREMAEEGVSLPGIRVIRLLLLTGARRQEIQSLKWREIDLERGFLRLERSKTGPVVLPLSSAAAAVIHEIRADPGSDFVFPAAHGESHYVGTSKIWSDVRKRANLEGVRLHDLRHTFASIGVANNFGLMVVGKILGHSQPATTARYAHLADSPVRIAAERISREVNALLNGKGS